MQNIVIAVMVALVLGAGGAEAQRLFESPCCAVRVCTAWDSTDGSPCSSPNVGKRCLNLRENIRDPQQRDAIAGCVRVPGGACTGGSSSFQDEEGNGGIQGCSGIFPFYFVPGEDSSVDADYCTAAAVDACCEAGACTTEPLSYRGEINR